MTFRKLLTISAALIFSTIVTVSSFLWWESWNRHHHLNALFRTSPHCVAPCWQGLTPNNSTQTELDSFLNSVDNNRIDNLDQTHSKEFATSSYRWDDLNNGLSVEASFEEETVLAFEFDFRSLRRYNATIQDVIRILGEPDHYSASVWYGRHGEIGMTLILLFKESDVAIYYGTTNHLINPNNFKPTCTINISPSQPFETIQLGNADKRWGTVPINETFQPWQGYGEVALSHCPDPPR